MAEGRMTIFGCDDEERGLFLRYAGRAGIDVRCVSAPLGLMSVRDIAMGSAVCVDHKGRVDARLIHALQGRGVRYLSSRSVGLDHIDGEAARAAGIAVENVAYSPESVAEHAVLLMLMALRDVRAMLRRVDAGDFRLADARARELRDMTVGVVGMGRIGRAVVERVMGFGCRVLAHDVRPAIDAPGHPSSGVTHAPHVTHVGFEDLLAASDVVTLHVPLTDGTRHMMDRARIARMRRDAILVNTARGALVDAQALADALEGGGLAFAALDVVEGEEGWFYRDRSRDRANDGPGGARPPFERLLALPNAIVTPHTAFYTEHALRDVVENVLRGVLVHLGAGARWAG